MWFYLFFINDILHIQYECSSLCTSVVNSSYVALCIANGISCKYILLYYLLYIYSILGWASFCFNYCLNSAWHGGDQFVALLRWCEAQVSLTVAFSSSAFFGLLFLIFLLTILHRFSMFRSGEFAGQLLAVWAGAKSCWKMKSASLKSWSAEGSMKCSEFLGKREQWRWFSKNTMDQHQQMTLHPNHHRLWKLNTGLQATWAMSFSTLPPDSRTLVSKWNTKLALIWKEDFGPLGNSPVLLLLSPGKTSLTTTVAKFLDTSVCGALDALTPASVHSLWSSPKFLNWFCLTILIRLRFSRLVVHLFPSTQLSVNMLGYSTLWTASLAMNVCVLPSLWRVSMIVFWTTVRSAVFPMIVSPSEPNWESILKNQETFVLSWLADWHVTIF